MRVQLTLTQQDDGRWFGRGNVDDGHGNEIDCLQATPEDALRVLLNQIPEEPHRIRFIN